VLVDEDFLAVEHVDVTAGDFAISRGIPASLSASSASVMLSRLVTPESELVVAPAGYILAALTNPQAAAARMSAALVRSVRYRVISGSKALPAGRAARMRWR